MATFEAAEFFHLTPDGIQVADYRHQWMDGERTILHKRWDSTPHHLDLANAPHHCHEGSEDSDPWPADEHSRCVGCHRA